MNEQNNEQWLDIKFKEFENLISSSLYSRSIENSWITDKRVDLAGIQSTTGCAGRLGLLISNRARKIHKEMEAERNKQAQLMTESTDKIQTCRKDLEIAEYTSSKFNNVLKSVNGLIRVLGTNLDQLKAITDQQDIDDWYTATQGLSVNPKIEQWDKLLASKKSISGMYKGIKNLLVDPYARQTQADKHVALMENFLKSLNKYLCSNPDTQDLFDIYTDTLVRSDRSSLILMVYSQTPNKSGSWHLPLNFIDYALSESMTRSLEYKTQLDTHKKQFSRLKMENKGLVSQFKTVTSVGYWTQELFRLSFYSESNISFSVSLLNLGQELGIDRDKLSEWFRILVMQYYKNIDAQKASYIRDYYLEEVRGAVLPKHFEYIKETYNVNVRPI